MALLAVIAMFSACNNGNTPELKQGVKVIDSMTTRSTLEKSAFYVAYPDGTPSDYVRYIFSDVGSAEWPPAQGSAELDGMSGNTLRGSDIVPIPKGVFYAANTPEPDRKGMQVVLRGDDTREVLVIEGYLDAHDTPAIIEEKKLPKAEPEEFARLMYQSLIDTGASDGRQE
jgi:hypothetical protein